MAEEEEEPLAMSSTQMITLLLFRMMRVSIKTKKTILRMKPRWRTVSIVDVCPDDDEGDDGDGYDADDHHDDGHDEQQAGHDRWK